MDPVNREGMTHQEVLDLLLASACPCRDEDGWNFYRIELCCVVFEIEARLNMYFQAQLDGHRVFLELSNQDFYLEDPVHVVVFQDSNGQLRMIETTLDQLNDLQEEK